jgi:hypothetical protein
MIITASSRRGIGRSTIAPKLKSTERRRVSDLLLSLSLSFSLSFSFFVALLIFRLDLLLLNRLLLRRPLTDPALPASEPIPEPSSPRKMRPISYTGKRAYTLHRKHGNRAGSLVTIINRDRGSKPPAVGVPAREYLFGNGMVEVGTMGTAGS